jgi:hypothetical protein
MEITISTITKLVPIFKARRIRIRQSSESRLDLSKYFVNGVKWRKFLFQFRLLCCLYETLSFELTLIVENNIDKMIMWKYCKWNKIRDDFDRRCADFFRDTFVSCVLLYKYMIFFFKKSFSICAWIDKHSIWILRWLARQTQSDCEYLSHFLTTYVLCL